MRSLLPPFVATGMADVVARDAASIGHLGVRLTAQDVAAAAWRVVHERWPVLRGPHRAVGRRTKVLAAAAAVTPDWANRLVNARLAR